MSFENRFNEFIPELTQALSIPNSPDWSVKGFIDYYQNIYSISTDTKDMAKVDGRDKSSYNNLATYREWVESLRL